VIDELAEVIPQDKAITQTAGQQLIHQGKRENAKQIAKRMLSDRVDHETVKRYT